MAILCQLKAGHIERIHTLGDGIATVGRDPANTIVLNSPGVSWFHCSFTIQGPLVVVEDLGVPSGVLVDGRRILGPVRVRNGATVQIAGHALVCRIEPTAFVTSPTPAVLAHSPLATALKVAPAVSPPSSPPPRKTRFHFWWFFSWTGFTFGWTIRRKRED